MRGSVRLGAMLSLSAMTTPEPNRPLAVVAMADALYAHPQLKERLRAVRRAARAVLTLDEEGYDVVLVPSAMAALDRQLLRAEEANTKLPLPALDAALAAAQAEVNASFQRELMTLFRKESTNKRVASVQTQALVSTQDPALADPSLPLGPVVSAWRARELTKANRLTISEVAPGAWRRHVAALKPVDLLNTPILSALVAEGAVVITGAGLSMTVDAKGEWAGLDGVVSAERTAALIAEHLAAECLIMLSGREHLFLREGRPDQEILEHVSTATLRRHVEDGHLIESALPLDTPAHTQAPSRLGVCSR